MNDCTPPRAILLNRAYNAITRDDYTPESIQAAIERLFDATRTAALEEAAVIADANWNGHSIERPAVDIRAAKDGAQ